MPKETWGDLEGAFGPTQKGLSAKERDYAARTLISEAGADPMGQAAVMHVIKNRVEKGGFGEGFQGVIEQPYAFEPWLHAGTGKKNDPLVHDVRSPAYQQALKIVDAVTAGQIPDPTQGATHFYSPVAQRQLASTDNRALVPSWATKDTYKTTIGGHEFYAPDGVAPGKRVVEVKRNVPEETPDWMQNFQQEWTERQAPQQPVLPPQDQPLPDVPLPQAPTNWGAGRSALTGVTLGAYPYIEAGVEAAGQYLTGQAPSFLEARQQRLAELQKGREAYQQAYPVRHMLAEQGGALLGAAVPMGLGARGIAAGAKVLEGVAPAVGPALQAAGRFVSGQSAATAPGLLAGAQRAGSYAAQGATQGAGYGALTYGLQPEGTTLPEAVGMGALGGAVGASIVNPFISSLAAPLAAEIAPNLRSMAQNVNQKFGLNIRPTQIAKEQHILDLDARVIPAHVKDEQVLKFQTNLADQLGMRGQELTKKNVELAMRNEGQALSDIAANTTMTPGRNFFKDLGDMRADVYATTLEGNPLRAKVDQILMKIYNESASGAMGGEKFRAFTKKDGLLDKELLNSADPSFRQAGYQIKSKMFDMFHVSDPKQAVAYDRARNNYRKLLAVEPLTGSSGVVDPTKLLKRIDKYKLSGDMRELAEAGQFLPKTTSTGGLKAEAKGPVGEAAQKLMDAAKFLGPLGVPGAAANYLGIPLEAVGAGTALFGGGQYVGAKIRDLAMASPLVGKAVLSGRIPVALQPQPWENLLARGAAGMVTEVGAGKGQ